MKLNDATEYMWLKDFNHKRNVETRLVNTSMSMVCTIGGYDLEEAFNFDRTIFLSFDLSETSKAYVKTSSKTLLACISVSFFFENGIF